MGVEAGHRSLPTDCTGTCHFWVLGVGRLPGNRTSGRMSEVGRYDSRGTATPAWRTTGRVCEPGRTPRRAPPAQPPSGARSTGRRKPRPHVRQREAPEARRPARRDVVRRTAFVTRRACDGAGLLAGYRAAVANLAAHVDEINALNVFPVPDGDTGSNMLATARAALEEGEKVADQAADRVAGAISLGALMGARGNSGVITSQIFRGMSEGLGGKRRFNGLDLAHALTLGTRTA